MNPTYQKKLDFSMVDDKGKYKKGFAEIPSTEEMTIKSESYSIREMIDKFTTGILNPMALQRSGEVSQEYDEEIMNSEVPEFIDTVDVQDYVNTVNQKLAKAKIKEGTDAKDVTKEDAKEGTDEKTEPK